VPENLGDEGEGIKGKTYPVVLEVEEKPNVDTGEDKANDHPYFLFDQQVTIETADLVGSGDVYCAGDGEEGLGAHCAEEALHSDDQL
jgi:hypothetical protein